MVIHAEAAELILRQDPTGAAGALTEVTAAGRRALGQIRQFVAALRTAAPGPRSAGLEQIFQQMRDAGLVITASGLEELELLPEQAGQEVSQVIQEALTNALRHAGAVAVRLEVGRGPGEAVTLAVDNDAADVPWPPAGGHGLQGMRERVTSLGGRFTAAPRPGGFTVRASIPIETDAALGPATIGAGSR